MDPRRDGGARSRSGAFSRQEEPAGAAVAELAVQGRHLLQEDRPLGVAHLVSAFSLLAVSRKLNSRFIVITSYLYFAIFGRDCGKQVYLGELTFLFLSQEF